jgi:hypothetical protein
MRKFWLFRSNLKALEYYHQYTNLDVFKQNCHDYYLIFPIWLLENDYFDEVIIWRLSDEPIPDIIFNINNKKYIQRWVKSFKDIEESPPDISFWRGGFPEYDEAILLHPNRFGIKLYLGAGKRILPQYGGKYDICLLEDERDFNNDLKCLPFYKTANPYIFKPLPLQKHYDICWPANFTQMKYKGQDLFYNTFGACPRLKDLKIIHCGNNQDVALQMAKDSNLSNFQTVGPVNRSALNEYLNRSKIAINFSNNQDGCPRVSTEILMSGTPLLLRDQARLLPYYKKKGVIVFSDGTLIKKALIILRDCEDIREPLFEAIKNEYSFDSINKLNINIWKKI